MEKWTAIRGTIKHGMQPIPVDRCMVISAPDAKPPHHDFARVVVRMNSEPEDDKDCLDRVLLIASAPELEATLREMLDAFVPTVKSEFRLTQAQGSVSIRARALLKKLERLKR